jgi:hypothetical protein
MQNPSPLESVAMSAMQLLSFQVAYSDQGWNDNARAKSAI